MAVRTRDNEDRGAQPVADFVAELAARVEMCIRDRCGMGFSRCRGSIDGRCRSPARRLSGRRCREPSRVRAQPGFQSVCRLVNRIALYNGEYKVAILGLCVELVMDL